MVILRTWEYYLNGSGVEVMGYFKYPYEAWGFPGVQYTYIAGRWF